MEPQKSRFSSLQTYLKNAGYGASSTESTASSTSSFRYFSSSRNDSASTSKVTKTNNQLTQDTAEDSHDSDDEDEPENDQDQDQDQSSFSDEDVSEEDSDYYSDIEQIGRFSFGILRDGLAPIRDGPGFMSLDHYNWLVQRYLPWGEPRGIVPAQEPEAPPPIQPILHDNTHSKVRKRRYVKSKSNHIQEPGSVVPGESDVKVLTEPELRQKILEIAALGLSDKERDRRVQHLMTENYSKIKGLVISEYSSENSENSDSREDNAVELDGDAPKETKVIATETDKHETTHHSNSFQIDPNDMLATEVTYTAEGYQGCEHYSRGCKLQCPDCNKFYTCRLCHDLNEDDHQMYQASTKVIMCMDCKELQSPSNCCTKCGKTFGRYYCGICKLWENNDLGDKPIYHCDDCGICRIGEGLGKDFFHCKTCNICMSMELESNHKCIENSTECDCPICAEFMFTSRETVVFMKCGHPIHQSCYERHVQTSFKCPTCARTIINMAARFRILDAEIATTAMPEPYSEWKSIIICNDCRAKSAIKYHILGLKCGTCGSYNTAQVGLIKPEDETEGGHEVMARPHVDEVAGSIAAQLHIDDQDSDSSDIF